MAREYEAGEWGQDETPDLIQQIRDEIEEVRQGLQKLYDKQYPPQTGYRGSYRYVVPDPAEELRYEEARNALQKEENRLMVELRDMIWLVPPMMEPPHNAVTQAKAKEIMRHGEVHGTPLTPRQRRFFGAIAGGETPRKK